MNNFTKQDILNEIKRTAEENNGVPLGMVRFENETGIKPYDWGKHWSRFGDAQKEAGFQPNTLQKSYDDEFIYEKTIELTRKLDRFPTTRDFALETRNNKDFPSYDPIRRIVGTHYELAKKISEYCSGKDGYEDVVKLCESYLKKLKRPETISDADSNQIFGEVYLFKSGKYYKIGKTFDTVRRGTELRIQLPEKLDLIHSIKTDDPSGVEAYWHRRFEAKRMNGEWFDLNSSDLKAFKRWRKIV